MYCDTHCHLNLEDFQTDLVEVIQRARDEGVRRILVPGIDLENSRSALELAERFDIVYAAAGVHPNSARSWNARSAETLRGLLQHPKVVAVGEIGLDHYRQHATPQEQLPVLRAQLELAAEAGKPVILHCREAFATLSEEIRAWAARSLGAARGVFHAFAEGAEEVDLLRRLGMLIGVGGPLTYKNNLRLTGAVRAAGKEMLLLETDAPYLSPVPKRGGRNEPCYLRYVIPQVSNILNISADDVENATSINANRLFHWDNDL